jgi:Tfp pilus assembly protein PilF
MAVAVRAGSAGAQNNLGFALAGKEAWDDAIAAYNEAIRIKPDFAEAYDNLGDALQAKGLHEEALRAHREAIRLKPDFAQAYYNLGATLAEQGKLDAAVAAYEDAIRLRSDYAIAHVNLGIVLARQRDFDRAIACLEKGIELDPNNAKFRCNLAGALADMGDLDKASDELRTVVRLAPNYAMGHFNLGVIRERQGRFSEAAAAYGRGHELGSRDSRWTALAAERMHRCERFAELDKRLPAILMGEEHLAAAEEQAEVGLFCLVHKQLYTAAARFFADAFAAKPSLAEEFQQGQSYHAACAAALAASGQGRDASQLDEPSRARWRQQALEWLTADLARWHEHAEAGGDAARAEAVKALEIWQREPDLSGVRGKKALGALPKEEGDKWAELWREVDTILELIRGRSKK